MRYIGIDYGTTNVGVAVSDAGGAFAFPRATLRNDGALIGALAALARTEKADAFVMGDTKAQSGADNDFTARAESFAQKLAEQTTLTVHRVREDWSSFEAKRFAPEGSAHDDSAAAAIILQRFLDAGPRVS